MPRQEIFTNEFGIMHRVNHELISDGYHLLAFFSLFVTVWDWLLQQFIVLY